MENTNDVFRFHRTSMPDSRTADYCLGCFDDSVFIDFDNCENGCVCLVRISFDGYGCCNIHESVKPMNETDSRLFKEIIESIPLDQKNLSILIKKTISDNKSLIWKEALNEYNLL